MNVFLAGATAVTGFQDIVTAGGEGITLGILQLQATSASEASSSSFWA